MRTTLDISDEAYRFAKAIAADRGIGLGKAISEIVMAYANPDPKPLPEIGKIWMENGYPVARFGRIITNEEVQAFLAEND